MDGAIDTVMAETGCALEAARRAVADGLAALRRTLTTTDLEGEDR